MTENSANQAVQMAPSSAAEVLGFPSPSDIDRLIDTDAVTVSQINNIARNVMDEASTVISDKGHTWRVSRGQETFADVNGLVDLIAGKIPNFSGFQLWQEVNAKNQQYEPIYLIANGDVYTPVVTFQPSSSSIMKSQFGDLGISDPKDLVAIAKIVVPIAADSYRRTQDIKMSQNAEAKAKHRRVRKWIAGLVLAATITGGAIQGAPEATSSFHNWRETVGQEHRADQARKALESQRAAEAARQARLDREAKVRAFDKTYKLDKTIAVTQAGEVGSAQATDMFTDIKVPSYDAKDISGGLAHDISSPRAIEIKQYNSGETKPGKTVIKMNIKENQQFQFASDGVNTDSISIFPDAKNNTLTIIDNGPVGGTSTDTVATHVYIQLLPR